MTSSMEKLLRCPVCGSKMTVKEKSCVCRGERTHVFDFAKSGYLNFSLNHKEGDSPEATRARSAFLEAGYYAPLADRLEEILKEYSVSSFLDAGCGEGYYTNRLSSGRLSLGVDLSKSGIDHAAKVAKRLGNGAAFLVGSIFDLPVADASFGAVLNLFAPCSEKEFERVLLHNGILVLVGAGEGHLMGLKRALYDVTYENPGRADLPQNMKLLSRESLRGKICLQSSEQIQNLFSMTPYYWRTSPSDKEKLSLLSSLETEYDFDIFIYQKQGMQKI